MVCTTHRIARGLLLLVACAVSFGCSDLIDQSPTGISEISDEVAHGSGTIEVGQEIDIDAMITRVDLTNGSLTLSSRSETVILDESTVAYKLLPVERTGNPGSQGADSDHIRVPLALADFSLGDTIRVSAEVMDESTLKAVELELAGEFHDPWFDIQFTDRLASVDTLTREVTFQNNPFGGVVFICAMLNDADGNWLWLADFSSGELVDVKGHTIEGGVFEILVMQKVAE